MILESGCGNRDLDVGVGLRYRNGALEIQV